LIVDYSKFSSGRCNIASEVDCLSLPTCLAEGIAHLPVFGACTKYIICIYGEGTEQECASGTEVSPEAQKCVLDAVYECPYNIKTPYIQQYYCLFRKHLTFLEETGAGAVEC